MALLPTCQVRVVRFYVSCRASPPPPPLPSSPLLSSPLFSPLLGLIRYPPQGAGKSDPKGRAKANMTCLRCGQVGHWAANCPQSSTSPSARSPAVKRPASTTEAVAMTSTVEESALLIFQDSTGAERPECVMLDPGASAFLSGYGPFRRFLDHLRSLDFPVETIKMSRGRMAVSVFSAGPEPQE